MRTILHCDLNNFFASVECKVNPDLKKYPVAVCGSVEDRRGIVLAKNDIAKATGVSTGEPIWQAKQKCRNLVIVPPHFNLYEEYSRKTYEIYTRFTDNIEAFGIDECWLDVTGSARLFGNGKDIAFKIKETIKSELGLCISVGVSFNKIFAKLGSDMKKPDAITVISYENFKNKIWELPCSDLIGIGRSTNARLKKYSINTIGELANTSPDFLKRNFGICGVYLWRYANGLDNSPVHHQSYCREIKSVGNSTTCPYNLASNDDVWRVMYRLSQNVCERMRANNLSANGVQISIKTPDMHMTEYQMHVYSPVRSSLYLCKAGFELFKNNYEWETDVRAIGIRAINLSDSRAEKQLNFLDDNRKIENAEKLEEVSDTLKTRFGKGIIFPLSLKKDIYVEYQPNFIKK